MNLSTSEVVDIVFHAITYGIIGLMIVRKKNFTRYKQIFEESVHRNEKVHDLLHSCIEGVSITCRESANTLDNIQVRLSLAKEMGDNEQPDEILAIWKECHCLKERFRTLLEQHDSMEQCITDCRLHFEKTKKEFKYGKKFDKIAYNTMMSTWFGLIGMKSFPHNMTRQKISMLAIGGVVFGTSFVGLVAKCTSHEENGIDIVWHKMIEDLDKLQRKRIEVREVVQVVKWNVDAYEELAFKNITYSLKPDQNVGRNEICSSASENQEGQTSAEETGRHNRMNIQIDKLWGMTSLLQESLLKAKEDAVQNAFEIKDLFYLKNPIDLIDFF